MDRRRASVIVAVTMVILLNDDIVNSPLLYRTLKLCVGAPHRRCSVFIDRENLSLGHKTGLKTRERISPAV